MISELPFAPSEIFDFPTVDICLEGQTNINFPPQFGPYTFSDTLTDHTYTAIETETLSFTYSDGCFTYQDTLFISVESCLCPVWVPNVFAPNEDGLNDLFKPVLDCNIYDYQMLIFNRWGREIFQSNDIDVGWKGESPNSDFMQVQEFMFT
jgi:gliding motility-associated-like protein